MFVILTPSKVLFNLDNNLLDLHLSHRVVTNFEYIPNENSYTYMVDTNVMNVEWSFFNLGNLLNSRSFFLASATFLC